MNEASSGNVGPGQLHLQVLDAHELRSPFDPALPEAPPNAAALRFDRWSLGEARRFIADRAELAGLASHEVEDLEMAANEVVSNSIVHGGGFGEARIWREPEGVVCEVRDDGCLPVPLVRRLPPAVADESGRGLWLADQLCDLVQIRSAPYGTVVRMLKRIG